jgi:hypothetical protein
MKKSLVFQLHFTNIGLVAASSISDPAQPGRTLDTFKDRLRSEFCPIVQKYLGVHQDDVEFRAGSTIKANTSGMPDIEVQTDFDLAQAVDLPLATVRQLLTKLSDELNDIIAEMETPNKIKGKVSLKLSISTATMHELA